jgi:hypothetical protein
MRGVDAGVSPTYATLLTFDNVTDPTNPSLTIADIDVFGLSPPGVDLREANGVAITVCRGGSPLVEVCDNGDDNSEYRPDIGEIGCGGANWFAQAAEDARKTIWYLHNFEAPEFAW